MIGLLVCPYEKTVLELLVEEVGGDEIMGGLFRCPKCNRTYPIKNGIPEVHTDEMKKKI